MPTTQFLPTPDQYFASLDELDAYVARTQSNKPGANQTNKWVPRKTLAQGTRGNLLVCHDYKGGYVENPQAMSYTFNYWSTCDTFVYFSHHRVTIPPAGWVNAAHRQGTRMLGVLIFEGDAGADCLRLIVGKLPASTTNSVNEEPPSTVPVSSHYAVILAELAAERGFDGYLLNFECFLAGGLEQTRALAAWISILQSELVKRVGPHAETVWYDSVIFTGDLAWQDRLNSFNLPFFIPSSAFFSNYTWDPSYTERTAQYYLSLDPNIIGTGSNSKPKTLQDVQMGVDVWGRGSYGGGGFGAYKAIEQIAPDSLGLSVALFAPGWTWETRETESDFTWDLWWNYERDLWAGSPDPNAKMPVPINKKAKAGVVDGPFQPFKAFFPVLPPPDPHDVAFHTTFCPGVGLSWFVAGSPVHQYPGGWTDIDKQTAMGDLLWPRPALKWQADSEGTPPDVAVSVNMNDAWNSGSSIKLNFTETVVNETLAHRSFWVPIQSVSLTTQKVYTATIVYKPVDNSDLDLDVALTFQSLQSEGAGTSDTLSTPSVTITPNSAKSTQVTNDWTKVTIQFTVTDTLPTTVSVDMAVGLVVSTVSNNTSIPFALSLLLGQINIFSTPSPTIDPNTPRILWVDYQPLTVQITPAPKEPEQARGVPVGGQKQIAGSITKDLTSITWQPATSLQAVGPITITSPDDPTTPWTPQPPLSHDWFPGFLYYNIYASAPDAAVRFRGQGRYDHKQKIMKLEVETGMFWVGTSGADGTVGQGKSKFTFDRTQLPAELRDLSKIRIFVQGVLETGEILDWGRCAYVDVQF